jgi:hypothetical protein
MHPSSTAAERWWRARNHHRSARTWAGQVSQSQWDVWCARAQGWLWISEHAHTHLTKWRLILFVMHAKWHTEYSIIERIIGEMQRAQTLRWRRCDNASSCWSSGMRPSSTAVERWRRARNRHRMHIVGGRGGGARGRLHALQRCWSGAWYGPGLPRPDSHVCVEQNRATLGWVAQITWRLVSVLFFKHTSNFCPKLCI